MIGKAVLIRWARGWCGDNFVYHLDPSFKWKGVELDQVEIAVPWDHTSPERTCVYSAAGVELQTFWKNIGAGEMLKIMGYEVSGNECSEMIE